MTDAERFGDPLLHQPRTGGELAIDDLMRKGFRDPRGNGISDDLQRRDRVRL